MNSRAIVWLDLETTGLDSRSDRILELGVILTDWQLNELGRSSWVVHYPSDSLIKLPRVVKKMHTENKLLDEVEKSPLSLEEVEHKTMRFLTPYLEKGTKFIVGGNSVTFDKLFIEHCMPLLDLLFHHRIIDATSVGLISEQWCSNSYNSMKKLLSDKIYPKENDHRALGDLDKCLNYMRCYKNYIFVDQT